MALVYLLKKPQISGRLTRWFFVFVEYDFKIVYKPSRSHLMAYALSILPNQIEHVGVHDQTFDCHMFTLQPKWLQNVYEYLLEGVMLKRFTISQIKYFAQKVKPFVFQEGVLYRFGHVNRFCQVLQLEQVPTILQELHGGVVGGHFSSDITMKIILDASYWSLMANRDVHEYCQSCDQCQRIGNLFT
jgi:hypothetical protein